MKPVFVELRNVTVARGETVVLREINLCIDAGEHVAILGPNGCGKSTLLKTITCECYPLASSGTSVSSVSIFGRPRWDLTLLRRRLGVVEPGLPGRPMLQTRGRDAILTGFFSSSTLWPNLEVTAAMERQADRVLELVDAKRLADVPVGHMSAGQQRRVMIGRALAGSSAGLMEDESPAEPRNLLLDEPSNGLDLAAQRGLRELLRRLAGKGIGVLLITHHLPDILPEMGRVILMREGRIVADGAKEDLLTSARLSELFGTTIEVTEKDGSYDAR